MAKGPKDIKLGAGSLWRNPNLDGAPRDALVEALDVEFTRSGGVKERDGAGIATTAQPSVTRDRGNMNFAYWQGGVRQLIIDNAGNVVQPSGANISGLPGFTKNRSTLEDSSAGIEQSARRMGAVNQPMEFVDGTHFFLTDRGVHLIGESKDGSGYRARRAGFHPIDPGVPLSSGSQTLSSNFSLSNITGLNWLATAKQVVYRFVLVERTPAGSLLFGPPSPRVQVVNDTGGDRYVTGTVGIPHTSYSYEDPDSSEIFLQVYRSSQYATASTPDDELRLVAEVQLSTLFKYSYTSSRDSNYDANALQVSFTDVTSDVTRGAYLYTAPSQGGALQANYMPPVASTMESFGGRIWYAPHEAPGRYKLDIGTTLNCSAVHVTESDNYFSFSSAGKFGGADNVSWTDVGTGSGSNIIFVDTTGSTSTGDIAGCVGWAIYESTYITEGTYITAIVHQGSNVYKLTLSQDHLGPGGAFTPTIYAAVNIDGRYYAPDKDAWADITAYGDEDETAFVARSLSERINLGHDMDYVFDTAVGLSENAPIAYYIGDDTTPGGIFVEIAEDPEDTHTVTGKGGAVFTSLSDSPDNYLYYSRVGQPGAVPLSNFLAVGDVGGYTLRLRQYADSLFVFRTDGIYVIRGNDPTNYYVRKVSKEHVCVNPRTLATTTAGVIGAFVQGFLLVTEAGVQPIGASIFDGVEYRANSNTFMDSFFHREKKLYIAVFDATSGWFEGSFGGSESVADYALVYDIELGKWSTWSFDIDGGNGGNVYRCGWMADSSLNDGEVYSEAAVYMDSAGTTSSGGTNGTPTVQWGHIFGGDISSSNLFDSVLLSFSENALTQLDMDFYGDFLKGETVATESYTISSDLDNRRIVTTLVPRACRITSRLGVKIQFTGDFSLDGIAVSYVPLKGVTRR